MGAETKDIITLSYVTDTDTGYYELGEIEGAAGLSKECQQYIEQYGNKGVEHLLVALGNLAYRIRHHYYTTPPKDVVYAYEKTSNGERSDRS